MRMAGAAEGGRGKGAPGARRRPWAPSHAGWARTKGRKGGGGQNHAGFAPPPLRVPTQKISLQRALRARWGRGGKARRGARPRGARFAGAKSDNYRPRRALREEPYIYKGRLGKKDRL